MPSLTQNDRQIVYYFLLPANILSVLGCIFILTVYSSFKTLQQFAFRMIVILSLFDLGSSISLIIPTYFSDSKDNLCQAQSILLSFFAGAGVIWTAFIAVSLYMVIIKNTMVPEENLKFAICSVILFNLILTIIPISTESYGVSIGWCWIKFSSEPYQIEFIERLCLFFIPLWIVILFNLILYTALLRKSSNRIENEEIIKSLKKKLRFYPLILIICYLPYTLKVMLEISESDLALKNEKNLTIIAGVCRSLPGFLNAVVYGSTKQVKKLIWKKICPLKEFRALNPMLMRTRISQKSRGGSHFTIFSGRSSFEY